jgi:hypothetical protein
MKLRSRFREMAAKAVEAGVELGKKGIEKGAEISTRAYYGAKESAQKGREKARAA